MRLMIKPFRMMLERLERQLRLNRRGSVLILVVALLVLMALIGTAYISTTRIDRYSIRQNALSNQVDLAAESVVNMTINAMDSDLFDGMHYRGVTTDPSVPSTYDNWDGFATAAPSMNIWNSDNKQPSVLKHATPIADPNDAWLASRYPRLLHEDKKMSIQANGINDNPPVWESISYPLFENIPQRFKGLVPNQNFFWQFDAPDARDDQVNNPGFMLSLQKHWFEPTFKTVTAADGTVHTYPALRPRLSLPDPIVGSTGQVTDQQYKNSSNNSEPFLAADADGDGIADAGLFKLPMGDIGGIRYYAGVRIIDNNSAININTAWAEGDANYRGERTAWSNGSGTSSSTTADRLVTNYFQNSIDLGSLLWSFDPAWKQGIKGSGIVPEPYWQQEEVQRLKRFWWGINSGGPDGITTNFEAFPADPFYDEPVFDDNREPRITWVASNGKPSYEFQYTSVGDAMYAQLGRRLFNPGWNYERDFIAQTPDRMAPYSAFGSEDSAALIFHFGMINPRVGRSPLEELFYRASLKTVGKKDSVYTSAANYDFVTKDIKTPSYAATDLQIGQWFKDNFYYDQSNESGGKREIPGAYTNPLLSLFHPRRTMLVTHNPVSNQAPRRDMRGLWNLDIPLGIVLPSPQVGALTYAGTNQKVPGPLLLDPKKYMDATGQTLVIYNGSNMSDAAIVNKQDVVWTEQMPFWNSSQKYGYSEYVAPKASANTSNFGELWRAFWNVMSVEDGTKTPFDRSFEHTIGATGKNASTGLWGHRTNAQPGDGYTLNDPYVGQKFWDQNVLVSSKPVAPFLAEGDDYNKFDEVAPTFVAADYPFTGTTGKPPQGWHPARMFRSSIRATPKTGTGSAGLEVDQTAPFDESTPRFPALQEMLLRAAIAAVNTEDLRDSDSDKDILDPIQVRSNAATQPIDNPYYVARQSTDPVQLPQPPRKLRGHGTGDITAHRIRLNAVMENTYKHVNVVVYGNEKQPFISEVFASTDPGVGADGYVAVELYNPYDDDIEMTNWKLVAIDRRHDTKGTGEYRLKLGDFPDPLVSQPGSPDLIADFDIDHQVGGPSGTLKQQVWPIKDVNDTYAPLIVPAHGYLLLENYHDGVTGTVTIAVPATKRPKASGLPEATDIPQANRGTDRSYNDLGVSLNNRGATGTQLPQLNVAFVPGLSGFIDTTWTVGTGSEGWGAKRTVFNRELVLLRPRRADGVYSRGFYPPLFDINQNAICSAMLFDENWSLNDLVPVDSFDFTGLQLTGGSDAAHGAASAAIWHYVRQNADAGAQTPDATKPGSQYDPGKWKFVYPGRYDAGPSNATWSSGTAYPGATPIWGASLTRGRQQGTEVYTFAAGAAPDVWPPAAFQALTAVTLGSSNQSTPDSPVIADNNNITASYPTRFPIQLHAQGWQVNSLVPTGWMGLVKGAQDYTADSKLPSYALFPFGGIGRNGDLLQIPFIGAYRVSRAVPDDAGASGVPPLPKYANVFGTATVPAEPPPGENFDGTTRLIELNSITMDSIFAEDTDLDDDPRVQMNATVPTVGPVVTGNVDPTQFGTTRIATKQKWRADDRTTQGREQIGRFCPLITLLPGGDARFAGKYTDDIQLPRADYVDSGLFGYPNPRGTGFPTINEQILINDYAFDPSFRPFVQGKADAIGADWDGYRRYHWATHLFDFLTVQAPHDDSMADYPRHQPWQVNTHYTPGMMVEYIDRINKVIPTSNQPNPLYMKPCVYLCTKQHDSGSVFVMGFADSFLWNSDPMDGKKDPLWHMLPRIPQSNSGGLAGNSGDARAYSAEYSQPVEGLININTANWKVLSALPLIVNPNSGQVVDPNADPSTSDYGDVKIPQMSNIVGKTNNLPITYRQLNEELARAIEYFRDRDGQANPADPATGSPKGAPIMAPHGPFKSIYELNEMTDLRPPELVDWKDTANPAGNPFRGHGFADGMGLYTMQYLGSASYLTATYSTDTPGDGDPDGGLGDLSPGIKVSIIDPVSGLPGPLLPNRDGVRGDFEEQFLQLSRISNLITTRSDSFTCYVVVQGWKNAGTPQAEMVLQKRVAYIIDRSMAPYQPVKKTLVPND